MIVVGLTGSIGMGKTTTSAFFKEAGVPVHDSDAAVHELYAGPGAGLVEAEFPGVTVDGKVDRAALAGRVLNNSAALARLEAVVHPFVGEARRTFLRSCRRANRRIAVLDIPLLFEIGGAREVDIVVVASAAPDIQRARVLARPGMTETKFEQILSRQTPDAEKRRQAHFVVDTGKGLEFARRRVEAIIRCASFMADGAKGGTA
jgi:dephospho-CoA kinase